MEKANGQLSRAEVYGESVLEAMRKNPGDCNLFDSLVPEIGNNPLIVFGGVGGGSVDLAFSYLRQLTNIHNPICGLQTQHKTPVASKV